MFDNEIFGFAGFDACKRLVEFANRLGYKNNKTWRLPPWDLLKKEFPFKQDFNLPENSLIWTDNASSASYTAKKMNVSSGEIINCSSREDFSDAAFCWLIAASEFVKHETAIHSTADFNFVVLPFDKMTNNQVDDLNEVLGLINYLGFQTFQRPTLEQLNVIYADAANLFIDYTEPWFWSASEGGRFKANWLNMANGEVYPCRKSADYSDNVAFSLALVF